MAYIKEINGRFKATIRIEGKRIARTFDTYKEALTWSIHEKRDHEDAKKKIIEDTRPIQQTQPKPQQLRPKPEFTIETDSTVYLSVADSMKLYLQNAVPLQKSALKARQMINQLLRECKWIHLPYGSVTTGTVRQWVNERLASVTARTVARHYDIIKAACRYAEIECDAVTQLEMLKRVVIKIPKQAEKFRRIPQETIDLLIWSAEQANETAEWMPDIIRFALLTAMRRSEIANLKWADVEIDRSLLRVVEAKNGIERTIPLFNATIAILEAHKVKKHNNDKVFGVSINMIYMSWKRCVKRAGVTGVRFHDLRHEAASRFFDAGLTPIEVAKMTGHKTMSQLMRYSHADSENIIAKMNEVLS